MIPHVHVANQGAQRTCFSYILRATTRRACWPCASCMVKCLPRAHAWPAVWLSLAVSTAPAGRRVRASHACGLRRSGGVSRRGVSTSSSLETPLDPGGRGRVPRVVTAGAVGCAVCGTPRARRIRKHELTGPGRCISSGLVGCAWTARSDARSRKETQRSK